MNTLSWFLYFADVMPSISHFLVAIVIFGLLGLTFYTVFYSIWKEKLIFTWKQSLVLVVLLVSGLIGNLIPEKNTFYAIAASELGEEAYKSKIGQKATQAIEQWIDSQIVVKEEPKPVTK